MFVAEWLMLDVFELLMCSVLTGVLCNSFFSPFSLIRSLLSGDFEELLSECHWMQVV